MSKIAFALLLVLALVVIAGCDLDTDSSSASGDPEPEYTMANLAGRWSYGTVDGDDYYMTLDAGGNVDWYQPDGDSHSEFDGDWTLNATEKTISIELTVVSGDDPYEYFDIDWTGSQARLRRTDSDGTPIGQYYWYSSNAPVNN